MDIQIGTDRTSTGRKRFDVYVDRIFVGRFVKYEYGSGYRLMPAYFCGGIERAVNHGGALASTKKRAEARLIALYMEAKDYAMSRHGLEIRRDDADTRNVILLRDGARVEMDMGEYCRSMNVLLELKVIA